MSEIVEIPLIQMKVSVNSLIAFILLLCIFFTFFSVTIELGGLDPTKTETESSCSHSDAYYEKAEVELTKDAKNWYSSLQDKLSGSENV